MKGYYYLITQFPMLTFGEKPSLKKEDFLSEASKWLSQERMDILISADINIFYPQPNDPQILKNYRSFEMALRLDLVDYRRVEKTEREYKPKEAKYKYIEEKGDSPLGIEKKLLFKRWQRIEEEERGHYFDFSFLIAYYLKLQILERLFTFDKETGRKKFNDICRVVVKGTKEVDEALLSKII